MKLANYLIKNLIVVGISRSGLPAPATHWGTRQGLPFHRTKGGLGEQLQLMGHMLQFLDNRRWTKSPSLMEVPNVNGGIWWSLNVEVSYHMERSRCAVGSKVEN